MLYVLTNGFMENSEALIEYNYACAFRTLESAKRFAKLFNILLKYDLYEISEPESIDNSNNNNMNINIMITKLPNSKKYLVQHVEKQTDFYDAAMEYFKAEQSLCLRNNYENLKINSGILFQKDKVIQQMFGNENQLSFAFVSNVRVEE